MKSLDRLVHYLPLGYLYLVILGIFKQTIVFYQLGINYLSYASIMDILLSPIMTLTDHPIIFTIVVLYTLFFFFYPKLVMKKASNKMRAGLLGSKNLNRDMSEEEKKREAFKHFIRGTAIGMLSFFLGFGWAMGEKTKNRLKNNSLKYKHRIILNTGETKDIHLIENNTIYYFYVEKGSKNIRISPAASLSSIEFIDNKALK